MAAVQLNNLRKTFGTTTVIPDFNLDIEDGEFLVLVGPSGCGKSTLLRMIAGLEQVSAGEVRIGERLVNALEPGQRDIAMVFQNYALYPHMKVYDNMAYGLRNRRVPKAEIDRRVRATAETLELAHLLERKPRELSGGQRQRVAMGRAIVREPQVFLFDEPLSNLDAKLRVQMRVEIKSLQRRLGTTSVYVTHDQVEAMTMADRLVILNNGRAEQVGTPIGVYDRPASRFVAGFIGSPAMNFLEGRLGPGGVNLGEGVKLEAPAVRGAEGRPVVVGLRPEHLEPVSEGGLLVQVDLVEMLGADTLIHGRWNGHNLIVRLAGKSPLVEGQSLRVGARGEHVHLFDPAGGARLE